MTSFNPEAAAQALLVCSLPLTATTVILVFSVSFQNPFDTSYIGGGYIQVFICISLIDSHNALQANISLESKKAILFINAKKLWNIKYSVI